MTQASNPATDGASWKGWGAATFAAVWAAVGAVLMAPPERAFMEEASAYTGKLIGFGMAPGLVAALVAHLLLLRGQSRRTKVLTYCAGAIVGAITSLAVHG